MARPPAMLATPEILPLTPDRWGDFEQLFGERGACAGCWCMWWRLPAATWRAQRGQANRAALHAAVRTGPPPGLLAYLDGEPAGWCAVAPRETYVRFLTSRTLKPVDARPVWSVVCFFVARPWRGRGLTLALLEAAKAFVRGQGGSLLEGYPVEPAARQADAFVFTGLAAAFRRAGFTEVARRSPTRPIMRCDVTRS